MATKKTTSAGSKPLFVEIPPNAARTMSALREMGYDSFSAVMDLIDNSLDAGAKRVDVTVREVGKGALVIDILDDGKGMDEHTLNEALRLGSNVEHMDPSKRLGKYGMGLVTASISMARNVWVLTREKGQTAYEANFDLDTIGRENKFVITLHASESGRRVVDTFGHDGHGTLVRLSQIDRISDTNASRFSSNLRAKLGQTYRHFLAGGVQILVNKRHVEKHDPLMLDHPQTEVVLDTTFDLGDGTKASLKIVELPELGTAGDAEAGIFPHNSGFYVVRNGREIIAGETFGFYRHHHSYSHFRAELSYHGNSTVFHEDIKKSSIHPDDKLREKLKNLTQKYIVQSGNRGRERGEEKPLTLTHKAAEEAINSRLFLLVDGDGKKHAAPKADEPRAEKPESAAKPQEQAPRVAFGESDEKTARFFTFKQVEGGGIEIAYNRRHPLVVTVAEAKQRQAQSLLHHLAVAFAAVEMKDKGASKVVEEVSKALALLAEPPATK